MTDLWHDERLLIDGQLVAAEGGATYETIDPSNGEVLGTCADASVGDAKQAIAAARRAFDTTTWSTDQAFRLRCLRQFHAAMLNHQEDFRELVIAEVGAPRMLTHGPQLDAPIEIAKYYADLLETYAFSQELGEIEVRGEQHRRWVEKEAAGVVAAIVPYNFPIQITIAKLLPALAAGCTVIVKGPPQTPWVMAAMGKIIAEETDIPTGVVNVLTGASAEVGQALVTDPMVDMISFTGSTATGRHIMSAASATVKKTFLELGGKSAFVVLDDAPLDIATMMAGFTVCAHAGQGCAITTRLLVPEAKLADAIEQTAGILSGIPYGDPRDAGMLMGPLISAQQRDKVDGMVQAALADGAKAVVGGGRPAQLPDGYFFEPTLLVDASPDSAIAQDEVFGPVLVVLPYRDENDAVEIANNSIFGLSAAVWGTDVDNATKVARRIRSGTVSINGGMYYAPDAPFGGYKQSGIGREMGVAGLEEYLEQKTLAVPAQ